jgi:hypothetical protein
LSVLAEEPVFPRLGFVTFRTGADGLTFRGLCIRSVKSTQRPEMSAKHSPPDELFQITILRGIGAPPVLALVHGAVHARFEERERGFVGARGDELVEFVDVAFEVAPHEVRFTICLARAEF